MREDSNKRFTGKRIGLGRPEMTQVKCFWCGTVNWKKLGIRKLASRQKQIYYCKACKRKFTGTFQPNLQEPLVKTEKKSYPINRRAYNNYQKQEKELFLDILHELCHRFNWNQSKVGRPNALLSDLLFACCLKIYTGLSARRLNSDIKALQEQGYLRQAISYSTTIKAFNLKELTQNLETLLRLSTYPLREAETSFSVDSTGFSTSVFSRWIDKKYGFDKKDRLWVKVHAMTGATKKIITAIHITESATADSTLFIPLVDSTAKDFKIEEVTADKAYSSRKNLQAVVDAGGLPYIPFRNNATGNAKGSKVWSTMYRYYMSNPQDFFETYHKRSNIEGVFSSIKRKFGHSLKTKTLTGNTNELLCKAICHNISMLIAEFNKIGINPEIVFGKSSVIRISHQDKNKGFSPL